MVWLFVLVILIYEFPTLSPPPLYIGRHWPPLSLSLERGKKIDVGFYKLVLIIHYAQLLFKGRYLKGYVKMNHWFFQAL